MADLRLENSWVNNFDSRDFCLNYYKWVNNLTHSNQVKHFFEDDLSSNIYNSRHTIREERVVIDKISESRDDLALLNYLSTPRRFIYFSTKDYYEKFIKKYTNYFLLNLLLVSYHDSLAKPISEINNFITFIFKFLTFSKYDIYRIEKVLPRELYSTFLNLSISAFYIDEISVKKGIIKYVLTFKKEYISDGEFFLQDFIGRENSEHRCNQTTLNNFANSYNLTLPPITNIDLGYHLAKKYPNIENIIGDDYIIENKFLAEELIFHYPNFYENFLRNFKIENSAQLEYFIQIVNRNSFKKISENFLENNHSCAYLLYLLGKLKTTKYPIIIEDDLRMLEYLTPSSIQYLSLSSLLKLERNLKIDSKLNKKLRELISLKIYLYPFCSIPRVQFDLFNNLLVKENLLEDSGRFFKNLLREVLEHEEISVKDFMVLYSNYQGSYRDLIRLLKMI